MTKTLGKSNREGWEGGGEKRGGRGEEGGERKVEREENKSKR